MLDILVGVYLDRGPLTGPSESRSILLPLASIAVRQIACGVLLTTLRYKLSKQSCRLPSKGHRFRKRRTSDPGRSCSFRP
jgi:hypothetical protein